MHCFATARWFSLTARYISMVIISEICKMIQLLRKSEGATVKERLKNAAPKSQDWKLQDWKIKK